VGKVTRQVTIAVVLVTSLPFRGIQNLYRLYHCRYRSLKNFIGYTSARHTKN
jgi:hypothetical protein